MDLECVENMGQTYSRLASVITDGVRSGKEKIMSSGMNTEQAKEYAKTMTYRQAISNVTTGKGIKYRKDTMIKLRELAEWADRINGIALPSACVNCFNHPSNGGSGICNCILGIPNLY